LQLNPLRPVIKIPVQQRILEKYEKDNTLCPCCKIGRLVIVYTKRFGTKPRTNQSLNRFIEYKKGANTVKGVSKLRLFQEVFKIKCSKKIIFFG